MLFKLRHESIFVVFTVSGIGSYTCNEYHRLKPKMLIPIVNILNKRNIRPSFRYFVDTIL